MADEDYRIQGTNFTYREWSEAYLGIQINSLMKALDYYGTWDLEMAYMNALAAGFTAGFRVLVPSYLGFQLMCEVTWVRADQTVTLTAYKAIDEMKQVVDHDGNINGQPPKPNGRVQNFRAHRFV